jgi:hypothetical protein
MQIVQRARDEYTTAQNKHTKINKQGHRMN